MDSEDYLWDETTLSFYGLAYALAHFAAILFFLSLVPLGFLLYKNIAEAVAVPEAAEAPAEAQ